MDAGVMMDDSSWRACIKEGKRLGLVAAPMMAVSVSQFLVQVISTMMVGRLGELSLASATIASSITNVTSLSVLIGMASALETLCGQAYGAKQYEKLGLYTYKAIVCLNLVCLPLSLILASMEKLLTLAGQDPLISSNAGLYAVWMIPSLFAYSISQPLMRFLQAQSLTSPMLVSSVTALCLHIPLCWVLVFKSGLGIVGAALAIGVSNWANAAFLAFYVKFSDSCQRTRGRVSKEAFGGLGEFFRLAVPSVFMICLDWWSYEVLMLLSGFLPNPKLETSVLSICLTSIALLYNIPYSLGAAASTRVSNELGAGNAFRARSAARVAMFLQFAWAIGVGAVLFSIRGVVGRAYSRDEEVMDHVTDMVPLVCVLVVTDSCQATLSGVARGCGWQSLGAYINFVAFYVIGIPFGTVLGFRLHLRGKGLWLGAMAGSAVQATLLSLITCLSDWDNQTVFYPNISRGVGVQLEEANCEQ